MKSISSRLRFLGSVVVAALVLAAPMSATWRSEGPFAGSFVDVSFDPHRAGVAYAAASNGGIFRSDDGGVSWMWVGKPNTGSRITWIEVDPGVAGTLWLGVHNPGRPSMWRSRDGGVAWEVVQSNYQGALSSMHTVGYRIAFAPSKPSEIWVPSTNLHFRSADGGRSWSDFRVPDQDAYAMAVDPVDPRVVYAGGHGGETPHLSRSDDGGATWVKVGAGLEPSIRFLVVDPAQATTVYAGTGHGALFKSTDRGATFAAMTLPTDRSRDISSLRFDRSGRLWLASDGGVFFTADGGATWKRSDRDTGRYLLRAVAVDPSNPQVLLAASAGQGVYRSTDAGTSWKPSREGLAAGWVEKIFAVPQSPAVFAQLGTGLFRREPSGAWVELAEPLARGGDAVELNGILFEPNKVDQLWAFAGSSAWRSADAGRTFRELPRKELSMREMMKGVELLRPQFRSLAQDAADPRLMWAGASSPDDGAHAVLRTTDAGETWKLSGEGLPAESIRLLRSWSPGVVLAVTKSELYRSTDQGGRWNKVGSGLPGSELRELVFDPSDPDRLFAAAEEGLFRSTDQGATWTNVGSALAEEDVEAVVVAPDGRVFAASFRGVFTSADHGVTFTTTTEGLVHRDVRALAISGGPEGLRLWAGTAGGSVYSTPLE